MTQLTETIAQLLQQLQEAAREHATTLERVGRIEAEVADLRKQLVQLTAQSSYQSLEGHAGVTIYPPLAVETRSHVDTACAAFHLGRKVQTLRTWASLENGPLRPIRVNGRLAWSVADIKRVMQGR